MFDESAGRRFECRSAKGEMTPTAKNIPHAANRYSSFPGVMTRPWTIIRVAEWNPTATTAPAIPATNPRRLNMAIGITNRAWRTSTGRRMARNNDTATYEAADVTQILGFRNFASGQPTSGVLFGLDDFVGGVVSSETSLVDRDTVLAQSG